SLDETVLDDPVALTVEAERVGLEPTEAVLPHLERLLLEGAEAARLAVAQGAVEVLGLDVDGAGFPPVGEAHPAPAGHVVADLADRTDRVLQRHVAQHDAGILEHAEQDAGGTDLQEGGVLA